MVTIKEVKTRKDVKEFINFPLDLYKNCPYFVPPLYGDEKALFKKDTIYSEQSDSVFFLAEENGKVVGRIQGILQHVSNEKWSQKRVRFTRFDSIDNQDVANALFGAVENWAKQKGMEEVVGPLGYSDLEREGLLIEGFDQISTFEEQYNYEYYAKLIENAGYNKEIDWIEQKLYAPKEEDPRIREFSDKMMQKYNLHFSEEKSTSQFVKKYGDGFFDILDKTYIEIFQSLPFTEKMKRNLIGAFRLVVNVNYAIMILDKDNNIVAFALAFPNIGKDLVGTKGKLTPRVILKLLKTIKNPTSLDLALVGVLPEYRNKAIATAIVAKLLDKLRSNDITHAETNLCLENNYPILNLWKSFDKVQHKRRRSFVKKI
jgi:GNAT superfamily N-acetyltransferase